MAKDNIKIDLKVDGVQDVDKATAAVKDLTAASRESANAVNELGETSDLFSEIKSKVQGAINGVKAFAKSFSTVKGAIAATGIGALLIAVTSLIAYFKNTEAGARALSIATAAMGIVMDKITNTFAKLGTIIVETFSNPQEAITNLKNAIRDNITTRIEGLIKLFPKLGEAISLTFSGKFKEAGKVAADAVLQVGLGVEGATDKIADLGVKAKDAFNNMKDEVMGAVAAATKLVDGQEALRKAINAVKVENAQLNRELETQKQIGEDTTKGYEERRAALLKAGEAQVAIANNSREEARLNLSLLQLQRNMTSNIEERRGLDAQVADARATQIEAQTAYEIELQDVKKVTREIDIEELERVKAISDLIQEATIDNTLSKFDAAIKQSKIDEEASLFELGLLKATEEQKQLLRDGFNQQRVDLEAERVAEEKEIADKKAIEDAERVKKELEDEKAKQDELTRIAAEADAKRAEDEKIVRDAKVDGALNVLSTLSSLTELFTGKSEKSARKAFKIQKALQIAETTINTIKSATAAFSSLASIPVVGVPLGIAAAAGATAAGLVNIKKIASTSFDGGGGAPEAPVMPSVSSVSSPGVAPVPSSISLFGNPNGSSTTQDSQALGSNQQSSIRAYVVEQDITDTQNTLQQYKLRSEIG